MKISKAKRKKASKDLELIYFSPKPTKKEYDQLLHSKDVRKAIRATVREFKQHFKEDGWDIDTDHVLGQFLNRFFGTWHTHANDLLIREMCSGCDVSWGYRKETEFKTASGYKGTKLAGFVYSKARKKKKAKPRKRKKK